MAELDAAVGRYVHLDVTGEHQRVYFEEAGSGTPLLCLHTAGADSRQYRHMLADAELLKRYRVIAFDLPWHGRSFPPDRWWEHEYLQTTDRYVQTVVAFLRALDLEQPVVLGCSMAGSLVLELARRHADEVGAVIGLSGAAHVKGRFADWSLRSDVNASVSVPSWVYGLMAPTSPERSRQELWWIYSQGGPGIYRGDTWFYSEDWDLRGREGEIDTGRCPVHLLTGEYDYACSAEESAATATAVPGARFTMMKDIGHFPMSENYDLFRTYLFPVLADIASQLSRSYETEGERDGHAG